jgi:uncharacterized membrane protein YcaP (DUF421 family)
VSETATPLAEPHDQRFQVIEWRLQRVLGWAPFLIVLAALGGWFGGGPVWAPAAHPRPAFSVLSAAAIYVLLLVLFRIVGRRTLTQITTFDVILLLIISEATQQAMVGDDNTLVNAMVVIATLASLDMGLAHVKYRYARLEPVLDGLPIVLVSEGRPIAFHLEREKLDLDDVLESAREQGVGRVEDIRLAVLERSGRISVLPM